MSSQFENLSDEAIKHIFQYVPGMLNDLTLVCSRFNNVICDSIKLMKYFKVFVSKKDSREFDLRPLLKSKRKYQSLSIAKMTGIKASINRFITDHASTLVHLHLTDCALSSTQFESILKRVARNLEERLRVNSSFLQRIKSEELCLRKRLRDEWC
jgi:hypothetical protein